MPEQKFQKHKSSLINKRLERLKNLTQETSRFWNHVVSESYDFEQVDHDVAHLEKLTKDELMKFFDNFISPASPTRAKLAVHLVAQGTAAFAIDNVPAEAKIQLFLSGLKNLFDSYNIETNIKKLERHLQHVDISAAEPAPLTEAVLRYLVQDVNVPTSKAKEILDQGLMALNGTGNGGGNGKADSNAPTSKDVNALAEITLIQDVHAFKASLQVSAGPQPVKDLSEFEDIEAKL